MSFDLNEVVKIYFDLSNTNNPDFIKYSEDIEQCRMFNNIPKQIKSELNKSYNHFMISNGLFNCKFRQTDLTDEQITLLMLLSNDMSYKPEGYQLKLWNFYHSPNYLDCQMNNIYNNFISYFKELINGYYSQIPYMYFKYRKDNPIEFKPTNISSINTFKKYNLKKFIEIGQCLQFNVEGFPKNELLYLLWGMCVVYCRSKQFDSFIDLLKTIIGFIQINILSKCFICTDTEKENYNLITYIRFGDNNFNFRYKPALKYIDFENFKDYLNKQSKEHVTKLVQNDKNDLFILTELNHEGMKNILDELETLYKNKNYSELISKFFDSQYLTRSTCLTGCLLILILKNKMIKFHENEMPDWYTILTGKNAEDTYEELEDIPNVSEYPETLNDVLSCLINYTVEKINS